MHVGVTIVSLLLMAEPVHLAITLSMHFLWMAALHSERHTNKEREIRELKIIMKIH